MSETAVPKPPEPAADRREAILRELDQILTSRLFKNSRRCGPLLRYVVTEALEGRADRLKERTIGSDVFGRKPDYDTAADPIVRTTASEVRKRIAQYYHEHGATAAVWIDLTPGSYVPEFRFAGSPGAAASLVAVPVEELARPEPAGETPPEASEPAGSGLGGRARSQTRPGVFLAILATALAGIWYLAGPARSTPGELSRFWEPFWRSGPAIIAIGGGVSTDPEPAAEGKPLTAMDALNADRVGFVDAAAVASVVGLFRERGKQLALRRGGALTLEDLRKVPSVLVGSNNPWTVRLLASQRFYIEYGAGTRSIALRDRQRPAQPVFSVDLSSTPAASQTVGYAVISRFVDRTTEQPVLILAGLGREGTTAAAEFVTEPKYLRTFERQAPPAWARKNVQIVISTEVVNASSGPPRLVAIHVW